MGTSALTQPNYAPSNFAGGLNQQLQAQKLQGAIAQVQLNNPKSSNAKPSTPIQKNVEIIFKPAKLNYPTSNVTVFSSGLGGLRRGDMQVKYGNYSEYGSNVLQLAGALVTLPVTGTIGVFISVIYASAELNEAYKAYLAGDKKGVIFHLGLAGISAIPAIKQMMKAFKALKSAKVAAKAQKVPTLPPIEGFIEHSRQVRPAVGTEKPFSAPEFATRFTFHNYPTDSLKFVYSQVESNLLSRLDNYLTKYTNNFSAPFDHRHYIQADKLLNYIYPDGIIKNLSKPVFSKKVEEFLALKGY
jgi:hypothetical protein